MAFKDMSAEQRIVAVHVDFMRNKDFCILAGVTQIGTVTVDDKTPTAVTNGRDVRYGRNFVTGMSRKQLRYLVAHENYHKAMQHCTAYVEVAKKYPQQWAMAVDYVVNQAIEDADSGDFVERPTEVPPLIDAKYKDMSALEVLRDLVKQSQQNPQAGKGQPMDEHVQGEPGDKESGDGDGGTPLTAAEAAKVADAIKEAVIQGEMMQSQLRGTAAGGAALSGFKERKTDWRGPLRRFVLDVCEGDDMSRYSPPNRRMLPLDILLPSHFSETTGEIIIACDTSGSMGSLYPVLFGEIASVCQSVSPSQVRVIWWDSAVAGEQVFKRGEYDKLRSMLQPKGGGGTTASCVAKHIQQKAYKPKAVIYLTDGYIESSPQLPPGNILWGVFGNERFTPARGRVLHLSE